jgi:pyridoxal phosphate-dependent aminotransferase EpsN
MSRLYLSPPHLGDEELALVHDAFASNWIAPLGPHVDAFERELAAAVGVPAAAALSSGTAALHLALTLLGVGPGDEVICPTLTFCASANPVRYLGAEPVFVDVDPATWCLDPALLEEELAASAARGRPPAAVVAVDLYGQCADYDAILPACAAHGVPVVEDAAEALGATYRGRPAGGFGAAGVLSFNGNKIITTSGGGALVAGAAELVARARFLASQARDPAPHYQHSALGYNYRLSNVLAAIGRGQLRRLGERVEARRRIFERYRERLADLPGVAFMPEAGYGRSNRWLTCITIDPALFGADREDVRRALEAEDVESRPLWKPLHLQPLYAGSRVRGGEVAAGLFARGLCLPSGSAMTDGDIDRVADLVRACRRP